MPGEGDPCAGAGARSALHCFTQVTPLALIRQLDRPGIVTLDRDTGSPSYAVLTAHRRQDGHAGGRRHRADRDAGRAGATLERRVVHAVAVAPGAGSGATARRPANRRLGGQAAGVAAGAAQNGGRAAAHAHPQLPAGPGPARRRRAGTADLHATQSQRAAWTNRACSRCPDRCPTSSTPCARPTPSAQRARLPGLQAQATSAPSVAAGPAWWRSPIAWTACSASLVLAVVLAWPGPDTAQLVPVPGASPAVARRRCSATAPTSGASRPPLHPQSPTRSSRAPPPVRPDPEPRPVARPAAAERPPAQARAAAGTASAPAAERAAPASPAAGAVRSTRGCTGRGQRAAAGRRRKLAITGGVYSTNPAQRMLIVGGQVFNEGSEVAPGVVLEQVRAATGRCSATRASATRCATRRPGQRSGGWNTDQWPSRNRYSAEDTRLRADAA